MVTVCRIDICAGMNMFEKDDSSWPCNNPTFLRFESGFFFRHPLMLEFDYYWYVSVFSPHTIVLGYSNANLLLLLLLLFFFELGVLSPVSTSIVTLIMILSST